MNLRTPLIAISAIAAIAAPAALAHRVWMIASSTSVSGTDNWVTVDAAVSNDLFFFDHQPIRVAPTVTQPDGTQGAIENHSVGKFRATFDVHLTQQGTYRIGAVSQKVDFDQIVDFSIINLAMTVAALVYLADRTHRQFAGKLPEADASGQLVVRLPGSAVVKAGDFGYVAQLAVRADPYGMDASAQALALSDGLAPAN